jgi:hypothetical protein
MKAKLSIVVILFSLAAPALRSEESVPGIPRPHDVPEWVQSLRCRDLLAGGDQPNWAIVTPFSLWLHGYLSGLGSALPLENLPANSFHFFGWIRLTDFVAHLLTSCSVHLENSAVDTAIDAASTFVNLASRNLVPLRGTDGKWE